MARIFIERRDNFVSRSLDGKGLTGKCEETVGNSRKH